MLDWFLLVVVLSLMGLLEYRRQSYFKHTVSLSTREMRRRSKWANKRYYGFHCDSKKQSNHFNYRLQFFCNRSREQIDTPLSANIISLTNHGFEFDETRRGWRHIIVSDSNIHDFSDAYISIEKVTERVNGAYFNWNGVAYPAGCALCLMDLGEGNELTDNDRDVFLEFARDEQFSNLLKKMERRLKPLQLQESDLMILYATRSQILDDFVIFAENLKNGSIETFIYNKERYGLQRVRTDLEYDESKNLEDGKRVLLFMTYDETRGFVQALTVYRTENGSIEKKILNVEEKRFEIIPEEPILCDEEIEIFQEETENGFEVITN
ncbi:hypothetical protein GCK72_002037 [Caenorhabditis remanei]|uniref:Uncharacterized protein n=1 Tax=Caenorhabditis remanei TaxID=31234 RepID=A0A6A5HR92_CAERE|nr:hypothetical protein GCK72_002037 [Caenorhabditis remanei]KAF1770219.1 hypothetical protein GCK72_002037 [Caenorhabditis remanei]